MFQNKHNQLKRNKFMKKIFSALILSITCSLSLFLLSPTLIGNAVSHWAWYVGVSIATFIAGLIPNKHSNANKIILTAILMATVIPLVSYNSLELEYPNVKELSAWFWRGLFALGLLLGGITAWQAKKNGAIDNWINWSKIAHSNYLKTYLIIFAIAPMIVKTLNVVDLSEKLSFVFYCYWLCGLSIFFFLIFFKMFSPSPYKYNSFHQFEKESSSLVEFRLFAQEVLKALEEKSNIPSNEETLVKEDIDLLKKINTGVSVNKEDAFSILRIRGRYMNPITRTIVSIFIIVPAYIIPLVFVINIILVARVPLEMIKTGGFFNLLIPS